METKELITDNRPADSLYHAFECFRFDSSVSKSFFPVQPHRHYFCEVLLVREGTCRFVRKGVVFHLRPGDLIYTAPMIEHSVDSDDGKPVIFDVIKYSATQLRELPAYLSDLRRISLDAEQIRLPVYMKSEEAEAFHLHSIISEIIIESRRRTFAYDLKIRALLYLLITELVRFWLQKRDFYTAEQEKREDPILAVPAYIEQHIAEPLKVEDIAERFGMSYPWFAKRFHDYYGLSCKQFIERIRVDVVEQYLAYTPMDLVEISRNTGFSDCSHMVKSFHRLRGMTPGQFRTLIKADDRPPFSCFSPKPVVKKDPKG